MLWLDGNGRVVTAFEVEHSTSIYSGVVRLPDDREREVRAQLMRTTFRQIADLRVRFIAYCQLEQHRGAMARFGAGLKPLDAIARTLV